MLEIYLGLVIGKFLVLILRIFNKTGTALPGLVVERIFPNFLKKARRNIDKVIVITGTNGKTTTQNLLGHLLKNTYDAKVIVNSRGANLSRGLVSEIIKDFSIFGKNHFGYAIFEVEEATLPKIVEIIQPSYFIITNFFRDQLDAYGEIERTKMHVRKALDLWPSGIVIANGDDPQVISMLEGIETRTKYITIENHNKYISYEQHDLKETIAADLSLPEPIINDDLTLSFKIDNQDFHLKLPGFHNYYSFAFCYELLRMIDNKLKEKLSLIAKLSGSMSAVYGRGEVMELKDDKSIQIFLVKNPVGFDLILDLLLHHKNEFRLSILINDKIADGKDVSWLWDSNIEKLNKLNISKLLLSGERNKDMQLRIKYANKDLISKVVTLNTMSDLVSEVFNNKDKEKVIIIATYTAMNQVREIFAPSHK